MALPLPILWQPHQCPTVQFYESIGACHAGPRDQNYTAITVNGRRPEAFGLRFEHHRQYNTGNCTYIGRQNIEL
jgi:hypothetical protein